MENVLKQIKETILNTAKKYNIEIDRIILFGSRARGDYREDSDYDILIVIREKLNKEIFWNFYSEVHKELVRKLLKPVEIIIIQKDRFEEYRNQKGFIYYWAEKEGILIT